ncbi:MAG: hypothetical protein KBE16_01350 [Alphaproteobacteria bacterium]|jgi:hypothetical protein|nr:hypothetical protein [Alphaproteobacteria bacterium]MBP9878053.1 hypothetical protein [Alphaproteobacteria bacterium]
MEKETNYPNRIYLLVPFSEKDKVKKLGARWDPDNEGWYIDSPLVRKKFNEWLPEMYKHSSEPPFVRLNFFPMATSGHNVRSVWNTDEWNTLRKQLILRKGNRCSICGQRNQNDKGEDIDLECHEHWDFEPDYTQQKGIQRLIEFILLCKQCHTATHIHILQDKKEKDSAYELEYTNAFYHLCCVNRWQVRECELTIEQEILKLKEFEKLNWVVDISVAITLYKTLVNSELSNKSTIINCYKSQDKKNSDDLYEADEHYLPSVSNLNSHPTVIASEEILKQKDLLNASPLKFTKHKNTATHSKKQNSAIPIINNTSTSKINPEKFVAGIVLTILVIYAYLYLSKPSTPLQSAALPPQSTQPIKVDIPTPPQENTRKPNSEAKKSQNQYRKCEPVQGQPGAKMCQDQRGQWHLITP